MHLLRRAFSVRARAQPGDVIGWMFRQSCTPLDRGRHPDGVICVGGLRYAFDSYAAL